MAERANCWEFVSFNRTSNHCRGWRLDTAEGSLRDFEHRKSGSPHVAGDAVTQATFLSVILDPARTPGLECWYIATWLLRP